jgi:hypothetical protein
MKNLSKKLALLFLMVNSSSLLSATLYSLDVIIPQSNDPIRIWNEYISIESSWTQPMTDQITAGISRHWQHVKRYQTKKVLAGNSGILITDLFRGNGMKLSREIWISTRKDIFAIRQKFLNESSNNVYLNALVPIYCKDSSRLLLVNDKHAKNWEVLVQHRLKNGRPKTVVPQGDEFYEVDQFALFHHSKIKEAPVLLAGFLSQTGHCARMILEFHKDNNQTYLKQFRTECEFDSCLVPPGGERTSQWFYLELGDYPNSLIAKYTDWVGNYHGIKNPPRNAPSVFCSWYFHGYYYNEMYFHNDLEALQKDHLPFDVFLIDECWSLNSWGDFQAIESWPSGMKDAAERIRALGYIPGIWSCPYLVDFNSILASEHPQWLLKDVKGNKVTFKMNNIDHWVLDPTFPGVSEFLEDIYRKLANDWGFQYFKFDFMRAVFLPANQKFFDPTATRLEAYRRGLEAIRRGTGPDAYLAVCGGHYGGSLGIANSQRSGSDVVSIWREREIPKFRQNILRTWMSRLWHVDPDAMMVRKRSEKVHDSELSLGKLTDREAQTIALNQYIGGGLITFSEYMPELGENRKKLYRHVIPSVNSSSIPLDIFNSFCPAKMLTVVEPLCKNLAPWITISIINWTDHRERFSIDLNESVTKFIEAKNYLAFEFFAQKVLGVYRPGDSIDLGNLDPHTSRLLRISVWDADKASLAGTDLHFSGGGVEILDWRVNQNKIQGEITTPWRYPVKITAVFPANNEKGFVINSITTKSRQKKFWINRPE